jgi:chemotaxis protein CheX
MPKETPWAKRARKVRAAKAAERAESLPRRAVVAECVGASADENDQIVQLPEVLDLAAAAPLARQLLARRGKPTVVDALGTQRPGAPCLQVLLAAIRTWESDGVSLTFLHCGPPLIEHLRFLGVDPGAFSKGAQS